MGFVQPPQNSSLKNLCEKLLIPIPVVFLCFATAISASGSEPLKQALVLYDDNWDRHKWVIVGAITLCVVEGLLIVGLLVQLAKRRRVEVGLRESEGKYSTIVETTDTGYMIIDEEGRVIDANREYVRLTGHQSLDQIRGRLVTDWIAPHDRAREAQAMTDCARLGYIRGLELDYIHSDGQIVPLEINGTVIKSSKGVRIVGLCRDITERKRAEEQVNLLQTIAMDVGAAKDLSSALEVVVRRVCEKTGWVFGQAWIPSQDGTILECSREWFSGAAGLENFRIVSEGFTFERGIGLPGRVWSSKQPLWVRDVTLDANFPRAEIAREAGLKAALGIPIISGDDVIAVIEFFLREPRPEDEPLVKVIVAVSLQLNLVIERKQAEENLLESHAHIKDLAGRLIVAQEEERKHIARELHDNLNQQLAAVAIGLGRIERYLPDADSHVRQQISKLEDWTTRLADRIRRMSHQLHSSTLEHVGLAEALRSLCSELAEQEGIIVDLEIKDVVGTLTPNVALCLYRIAQESLRNVAKHSGSKTAMVTLSSVGETIEMRVTDGGVGFEIQQSNGRRGIGLVSMEERVRLLDGSLELKSRPGAGTEVKAQIPLRSG